MELTPFGARNSLPRVPLESSRRQPTSLMKSTDALNPCPLIRTVANDLHTHVPLVLEWLRDGRGSNRNATLFASVDIAPVEGASQATGYNTCYNPQVRPHRGTDSGTQSRGQPKVITKITPRIHPLLQSVQQTSIIYGHLWYFTTAILIDAVPSDAQVPPLVS